MRVMGVRQYWRQEGGCGGRALWFRQDRLTCGSRGSTASALRATLTGMSSFTGPLIEVRCCFYTDTLLAWGAAAAAAAASFAALLGAVKEAAFAVVACLSSQQCCLIPCNSSAVICACFCGRISCCNDKSCREHRGGMKEWSKASSTVII